MVPESPTVTDAGLQSAATLIAEPLTLIGVVLLLMLLFKNMGGK